MERASFAPSVDPQKCVLKMNFACGNCHKKVRKHMQKIQGVHSIEIDANEGKVTVSSAVDPHVLIEECAKIGKKAQVLWEQRHFLTNQNNDDHRGKRVQFALSDAQRNGIDQDQLAQLQKFAENKRLKLLELNQTNNIKMTFNDNGDISHIDRSTNITTNNLQESREDSRARNGQNHSATDARNGHSHSTMEARNGHNHSSMDTFGLGQYGNIGGASSSRGHAPCYGGDGGGFGPTKKNIPPCCHDFDFNCGGGRWAEEKAQRPLLPTSCVPTGSTPTHNYGPCGATPPNHYGHHGSQPVNTLYADVSCGEDHKTCRVM